MTLPTKLIVFDWDGTLMDSEARIVNCMRAAITDLDLPERSNEQMKNIIGLGMVEALNALYPEYGEVEYRALTERYRHHFLEVNQTPSVLFAGVKEMLVDLHREGYFLAVATGKGRLGMDKAFRETETEQFFHVSRCADESFSKPHPDMLMYIMDFLGMEAEDTLMVGDTEFDLQMANNAKVQSVAVTYGVHEPTRLLEQRPLACVDNVAELHQWLKNNYTIAA